MNDELSRRLFAAARGETPPVPPADFARKVAAAVRREDALASATFTDTLAALLPRTAWAVGGAIALCALIDWGDARRPGHDFADGAARLQAEAGWLPEGF